MAKGGFSHMRGEEVPQNPGELQVLVPTLKDKATDLSCLNPEDLAVGWGSQGEEHTGTHIAVPLNGGTDLFGAWCDGELGLALESVGQRLLGHSC